MPAPKVRADYDQLTQVVKLFDEQADTTERTLQDLTQKEQVLQGGDWIGQGAQTFYNEMEQSILPAFRRLVAALRMASQITKAISDLVHGTEQGASSIFKNGASNAANGKSTQGMSATGGVGAGAAAGAAGAAAGAAAAAAAAGLAAAGNALGTAGAIPAWLSQLLGGGNGSQGAGGDKIDQFTDELHKIQDMLAGNSNGASGDSSSSDFPSQQILDAVKQDLAAQSDTASNGWQQQQGAGGGGSGGGDSSGGGSGSGGAGTPSPTDAKTDTPQTGGGGGGGGGSKDSPTGGGSMGSGSNSQVSGQQGMLGNAAGQGSSGGGVGGGGDTAGSFGAALVGGALRSAASAGAPIAEVALMVGASAGGLLFATKGGAGGLAGGLGGWAAGQHSQNAASPIYKAAGG